MNRDIQAEKRVPDFLEMQALWKQLAEADAEFSEAKEGFYINYATSPWLESKPLAEDNAKNARDSLELLRNTTTQHELKGVLSPGATENDLIASPVWHALANDNDLLAKNWEIAFGPTAASVDAIMSAYGEGPTT